MFPSYFRVELFWAKLAGLLVLLAPTASARLKQWACAGFAFTLVSALIAHFAIRDGLNAWGWAAGTGVLWSLSYFFFQQRNDPAAESARRQTGEGSTSSRIG